MLNRLVLLRRLDPDLKEDWQAVLGAAGHRRDLDSFDEPAIQQFVSGSCQLNAVGQVVSRMGSVGIVDDVSEALGQGHDGAVGVGTTTDPPGSIGVRKRFSQRP